MHQLRRHPSKLPQCILTTHLFIFTVSNLALLVLSLMAMRKTRRQPDALYASWAIYNYTACTAGVSFVVLLATIVTSVSRYLRASLPGPFLTPRYVRRCTLFTIALHALALFMVFHEAYAWDGKSDEHHAIPKSLLSALQSTDIRAGSAVFRMALAIILGGALLTGLSLAFEEPCVREYSSREALTTSSGTVQMI